MLISLITWCIAVPIAVPLAVLLVELTAGLLSPAVRHGAMTAPASAAILMPAHDEAQGIAQTIAALSPALGANIRLVVIADNCSDDTATIARQAGALVIERQDASQRGKGHALAFGRDWLRADPPACVLVLDADCAIDKPGIDALIATSMATQRPVQSCYLLRSRASDGPMVQISNFAFLVKNLIRQRGAARLHAPALLGGTGMAFPWTLIENAPLATSHLVEDLVLGIAYARAGNPPIFLERAVTWSDPASQSDTLTQRTRWEHGFLRTALSQGLPLIGTGVAKMRPGLIWLGLHLAVPPLVLLMLLSVSAFALTALLGLFGAAIWPAVLLGGLLCLVLMALALGWARDGRRVISPLTLARIPLYILWKIPVYLKLAGKRQEEWVRTGRGGD